ncbi:RluA family pseudouridine synthase [[Eubacterium] hominis]|uniref:RluA family pseudouridine synthase n=1 Tax=[Eubacterium] hominis TaxID=2764325 RepID=UPI003A4DF795
MQLQKNEITITIKEPTSVETMLMSLHLSKKQRYLFMQEKRVKVNHQAISQSIPLQKGDCFSIQRIQEADTIPAWRLPISIIYEDDIFLVVDKPSGLLVHSDGVNTKQTLCNAVKAYYDETNQNILVRPLHRLDVETSGLILFCKEPLLQPMLDVQLAKKEIHREYYAITKGRMEQTYWDIQKGIARDRHHAKRMRIDPKKTDARTKVQVLQQYSDYALVKCTLFTGRTHQIRVHLASIHHPILSDFLYGSKDQRIKRCALHAYQLSFVHPITEKTIVCQCDLPKDMKNLLR